jgi:Hint domain
MASYSVWLLEEANISVSGGKTLDGVTQGDGSHLVGETITLLNGNWLETFINDPGSDTAFDDNDSGQTLDGRQTINGVRYRNNSVVEAEYRIILQDSDGNRYEALAYNVQDSNPSYATIEGLSFVGPPQGWPPIGEALTVIQAFEGPGSTGQAAIDVGDLVVPCFTPGTRIRTPHGGVAVERLKVGDLVHTSDNGIRPLRWIGQVSLGPAELAAAPELRPIRITAGALGNNTPRRDMLISPQHRVLVSGWRTELLYGLGEMLAAAAHLVDGKAIHVATDVTEITYIHFMFDRHEIVFADGVAAESFRPGPMTLPALPSGSQRELRALFPDLDLGIAPARPMLKGWESSILGAAF